jgi:phospholipid/cholesterol/gamma-HCH transport system substrate-binding protein
MKSNTPNNIKLGIFVVGGLFFLILMLYMIGKNENLFGAKIMVKTRFQNAQGLLPGNNIRYSGIEVGTVKSVSILNDTTIEVVMMIKESMQQYIRKNAIATIGTDGLMGNKLVNINPSGGSAPFVQEGDVLPSRKPLDTDAMLRILSDTNDDIAVIADDLKKSIQRINNSTALWSLLGDESLPANLRTSMIQVRNASAGVNNMVGDLQMVVDHVQQGEGALGMVLYDTSFNRNLKEALVKVRSIGEQADTLSKQISALATSVHQSVEEGEGAVHALLKDKQITNKLNISLENLEKGTESFQQNMEALKSNFLFRGYFKKLERQQQQKGGESKAKDSIGKLSSVN